VLGGGSGNEWGVEPFSARRRRREHLQPQGGSAGSINPERAQRRHIVSLERNIRNASGTLPAGAGILPTLHPTLEAQGTERHRKSGTCHPITAHLAARSLTSRPDNFAAYPAEGVKIHVRPLPDREEQSAPVRARSGGLHRGDRPLHGAVTSEGALRTRR
jgi:hypothetical protein